MVGECQRCGATMIIASIKDLCTECKRLGMIRKR